MKILISVFIFHFVIEAKSQSISNEDTVYTFVETMPEFKGGKQRMMEYISANTYFPVSCSKENVNSKYTVSFIIDTLGKVTEVTFKEAILCNDFENELKDIFYKMPIWEPGIQDNRKVKVKYTHTIFINLK